jgi:hypothetical protein
MLYPVTDESVCGAFGVRRRFFFRLTRCVHARTHLRMQAYVHTAMLLVPGDLHDQTLGAVFLVIDQQPAECQTHQVVLAQLRAARQV